eukprot:g11573.t1
MSVAVPSSGSAASNGLCWAKVKEAGCGSEARTPALALPAAVAAVPLPPVPDSFTLKLPPQTAMKRLHAYELENATYMSMGFQRAGGPRSYFLWDEGDRVRQIGAAMLDAKNRGAERHLLFLARPIAKEQAARSLNVLAGRERGGDEDGEENAGELKAVEWGEFAKSLRKEESKEAQEEEVAADELGELGVGEAMEETLAGDDKSEQEDHEPVAQDEDIVEKVKQANVIIIAYPELARAKAADLVELVGWFKNTPKALLFGDGSDSENVEQVGSSDMDGVIAFEDAEAISGVEFGEGVSGAGSLDEADGATSKSSAKPKKAVQKKMKNAAGGQVLQLELDEGDDLLGVDADHHLDGDEHEVLPEADAANGSSDTVEQNAAAGSRKPSTISKSARFAKMVVEMTDGASLIYASACPFSGAKKVTDGTTLDHVEKTGIFPPLRLPRSAYLNEFGDDGAEIFEAISTAVDSATGDESGDLPPSLPAFASGKQVFAELFKRCGIVGQELFAAQLRARGQMSNRQNKADAQETVVIEVPIDPESDSAKLYRDLQRTVARMRTELAGSLSDPDLAAAYEKMMGPDFKTTAWQSFFRLASACYGELLAHCKVDAAAAEVEKALAAGKQPIVCVEAHATKGERDMSIVLKNEMAEEDEAEAGRSISKLMESINAARRERENEEDKQVGAKTKQAAAAGAKAKQLAAKKNDSKDSTTSGGKAVAAAPSPAKPCGSGDAGESVSALGGSAVEGAQNFESVGTLPQRNFLPALLEDKLLHAVETLFAVHVPSKDKEGATSAAQPSRKMAKMVSKMKKSGAPPESSKPDSAAGAAASAGEKSEWPAQEWAFSEKYMLARRKLQHLIRARDDYDSKETAAKGNEKLVFFDRNAEEGMGAVRHEKEALQFRMGKKKIGIASKIAAKGVDLGPKRETDVDAVALAAQGLEDGTGAENASSSAAAPSPDRVVIYLDLPRDVKDLTTVRAAASGQQQGGKPNEVAVQILRTDLPAEAGYLSSLVGRVKTSNALTRGDRSAGLGQDLEEFDLNTGKIAARAMEIFLQELLSDSQPSWMAGLAPSTLPKSKEPSSDGMEVDGEEPTGPRGSPAVPLSSPPQYVRDFWLDSNTFDAAGKSSTDADSAGGNEKYASKSSSTSFAKQEMPLSQWMSFRASIKKRLRAALSLDDTEEEETAFKRFANATDCVRKFYLRLFGLSTEEQRQSHLFLLHIRAALNREAHQRNWSDTIADARKTENVEKVITDTRILFPGCSLSAADVDNGTSFADVRKMAAALDAARYAKKSAWKEFRARPEDEQNASIAVGSTFGCGSESTSAAELDAIFNVSGFWELKADPMAQTFFVRAKTTGAGKLAGIRLYSPYQCDATEFATFSQEIAEHFSGSGGSLLEPGKPGKKRGRARAAEENTHGDESKLGGESKVAAGTSADTAASSGLGTVAGAKMFPLTREVLEKFFVRVEHRHTPDCSFCEKHWSWMHEKSGTMNLDEMQNAFVAGKQAAAAASSSTSAAQSASQLQTSHNAVGRRVCKVWYLHGCYIDLMGLGPELLVQGALASGAVRREFLRDVGEFAIVVDPKKVPLLTKLGKLLSKTGKKAFVDKYVAGKQPYSPAKIPTAAANNDCYIEVPPGFEMTVGDRAVLGALRECVRAEDAEDSGVDFSSCASDLDCALEFIDLCWEEGWACRDGLLLARHFFRKFCAPQRPEFLFKQADWYQVPKPPLAVEAAAAGEEETKQHQGDEGEAQKQRVKVVARPGWSVARDMVEVCVDEPAKYYELLTAEVEADAVKNKPSQIIGRLKKKVKKFLKHDVAPVDGEAGEKDAEPPAKKSRKA